MSCGIYKITNLINNKIYIGQSINIEKRWACEKCGNCNDHLTRAFKKYGIDNFNFEIIEECQQSELNEKESYYIMLFKSFDEKNGYNMTLGGDANGKYTFELSKEKERQRFKRYRENNKEKIKQRNKEKYLKNIDNNRKKALERYYNNQEKRILSNKIWKENNKDKVKLQQKKYREEHKEELRAKQKKYREEHKDKIKELERKNYSKHLEYINKKNKSICFDPFRKKFVTLVALKSYCQRQNIKINYNDCIVKFKYLTKIKKCFIISKNPNQAIKPEIGE